ncbi:hypothetical protein ABZY81_20080 [Streptomyces sp. NPDC006514]|uniref:hypothetical protein n=1 Tax=Streptomyces sp. NPDC006514 TaxID=3154308 RepID=UPI0033BBA0BA
MIQGFRPPHWLACAALAAATLAPTASAYAGPFLTPARQVTTPASPASPASPDDPYEELAGSVAGVGRDRPGRPVGEPANPELTVASRPLLPVRPPRTGHAEPTERTRTTPPSPSPPLPLPPPPTAAVAAPSPPPTVVTALDTAPNDRAAALAAHILPLGTGFALMGLGLGYLGMRLRRGI